MQSTVIPPHPENEGEDTPCRICGAKDAVNYATIKQGKEVEGEGRLWCGWGSGFHLYGENKKDR